MLVSGCELYDLAEKGKFAVGAFNFCTLTGLEAIVRAAEKSRSPAFLNLAEIHFGEMEPELAFEIANYYASKASVPLALHLDHGQSVETIIRTIRAGFTSVMIDQSSQPFEKNIQETVFSRRITKNLGICLEAELGQLEAEEGSSTTPATRDDNDPSTNFTDPAMALQFVEETDVDALAVAIGNAHGTYKGVPKLDFERLETISRQTGRAVVLHGGTGLSAQDFHKAIKLGVRKVNFYTGISSAAWEAVKTKSEQIETIWDPWNNVNKAASTAMMEAVCKQMEIFRSTNSV